MNTELENLYNGNWKLPLVVVLALKRGIDEPILDLCTSAVIRLSKESNLRDPNFRIKLQASLTSFTYGEFDPTWRY